MVLRTSICAVIICCALGSCVKGRGSGYQEGIAKGGKILYEAVQVQGSVLYIKVDVFVSVMLHVA